MDQYVCLLGGLKNNTAGYVDILAQFPQSVCSAPRSAKAAPYRCIAGPQVSLAGRLLHEAQEPDGGPINKGSMADREKRKASPPSGRNLRVNSPASFRLTHDISLDEFEDDDLSEITEITDECGMSLNCNGPDVKGRVRRGTNSLSGRAELGAVGQLQAEMLHLELIDGADGYRGDKESSKASAVAPPPVTKDPAAPVTMDTYRPKRPTTLKLISIVPRTQDTLNNNSFGKKYSWQEKVSGSSSPLKTARG